MINVYSTTTENREFNAGNLCIYALPKNKQ